jgi:hypothetical protein
MSVRATQISEQVFRHDLSGPELQSLIREFVSIVQEDIRQTEEERARLATVRAQEDVAFAQSCLAAQQAAQESDERNKAQMNEMTGRLELLTQAVHNCNQINGANIAVIQEISDVHNRTFAPFLAFAEQIAVARRAYAAPLRWIGRAPAAIEPPRITEVPEEPPIEAMAAISDAEVVRAGQAEEPPGVLGVSARGGSSLFFCKRRLREWIDRLGGIILELISVVKRLFSRWGL